MIDDVLPRQTHRLEFDRLSQRILSLGSGVRARIALEEIIEAAVFLKDDDDVFDLSGAGRIDSRERIAGRRDRHGVRSGRARAQ